MFKEKIISFFTIILISIIGAYIVHSHIRSEPVKIIQNQLPSISNSKVIERLQVLYLIDEVNSRNESIQSFQDYDFDIKIHDRVLFNNLTGRIWYEKPNNFRLQVNSFMGEEIDLGSNAQIFWIWSRRQRPEGIYYANHHDIYRTNLRTPFHPIWIRQILGFDSINSIDFVALESSNYIEIVDLVYGPQYKQVLRCTYIDKRTKLIVGQNLFLNQKLIASSKITKYHKVHGQDIPEEIIVQWLEEKVTLTFNFKSPIINQPIVPSQFMMPNKSPKIPLAP